MTLQTKRGRSRTLDDERSDEASFKRRRPAQAADRAKQRVSPERLLDHKPLLEGDRAWFKSPSVPQKGTVFWPVIVRWVNYASGLCQIVYLHPKYVTAEEASLFLLRPWNDANHKEYMAQGTTMKHYNAEWQAVLAETDNFSRQGRNMLDARLSPSKTSLPPLSKVARNPTNTSRSSIDIHVPTTTMYDSDDNLGDLTLSNIRKSDIPSLLSLPEVQSSSVVPSAKLKQDHQSQAFSIIQPIKKQSSFQNFNRNLFGSSRDADRSSDADFVATRNKPFSGYKSLCKSVTKCNSAPTSGGHMQRIERQHVYGPSKSVITRSNSTNSSASTTSLDDFEALSFNPNFPKPVPQLRTIRNCTVQSHITGYMKQNPEKVRHLSSTKSKTSNKIDQVVLKGFLRTKRDSDNLSTDCIEKLKHSTDSDSDEVPEDLAGLYVGEKVLVLDNVKYRNPQTFVPGQIVSLDGDQIHVRKYNVLHSELVPRAHVVSVSDEGGARIKSVALSPMPDLCAIAQAEHAETDELYENEDFRRRVELMIPTLDGILAGTKDSFRARRFHSRSSGRDLYQFVGRGGWSKKDRDYVHRLLRERFGKSELSSSQMDNTEQMSSQVSTATCVGLCSPWEKSEIGLISIPSLESELLLSSSTPPSKPLENNNDDILLSQEKHHLSVQLDNMSSMKRDSFIYLVLFPECLLRLGLVAQSVSEGDYYLPPLNDDEITTADLKLQEGCWPYTFLETIKRDIELLERQQVLPVKKQDVSPTREIPLAKRANRQRRSCTVTPIRDNAFIFSQSSSESSDNDDPLDNNFSIRS